jgi:proline dehydrogenase
MPVCPSVKPSQLGLFVDESMFREQLGRVIKRAHARDTRVWPHVENHTTTDATLDASAQHARGHGNAGVCVQASLKRTGEDLERLAELPGNARLIKGA